MTYEEAYGRAWRALAREEGHRPRALSGDPKGGPEKGDPRGSSDEIIARRRRVARLLAAGERQCDIAMLLGVTPAIIGSDARSVRQNPKAFQ